MHSVLLYEVTAEELATRNIIGLLRDLLESSILQPAWTDLSRTEQLLTTSPDTAKRFKVLLEALRRRNRIVPCGVISPFSCQKCNTPCSTELASASYLLLGATSTAPVGKRSLCVSQLANYDLSDLGDQLRCVDYSVLNIQTRDYWETNILLPFLRHAQSLDIIDWIAGDKWVGNSGFPRTLSWIVRFAQQNARLASIRLFTQIRRRESAQAVGSWCKAYGVKLENRKQGRLHMRALITNRFGLQVERGFDLLGPDGRVDPCHVFVLSDPGRDLYEAESAPRANFQ